MLPEIEIFKVHVNKIKRKGSASKDDANTSNARMLGDSVPEAAVVRRARM